MSNVSYKVRNVAKQKLRNYHVINAENRAGDEYIKKEGIPVSNKFETLEIPADGMVSVDPVFNKKVSKEDVKAGKRKPMIMSIHDLPQSDDASFNPTPYNRPFTGVRPPARNLKTEYRNEMKITLYNKGFERDMM